MPVSITLTVTSFQDTDSTAAGSRYCTVAMSLGPNPPDGVTLDPGDNNLLHVKGGAQDLVFTVAPPAGSTETYYALGFALKGPAGDKHGRTSFDIKNGKPDDSTFRIRNNWSLHGPAASGGVRYSFFVVIQRVSDKAIGIIDPEISNED